MTTVGCSAETSCGIATANGKSPSIPIARAPTPPRPTPAWRAPYVNKDGFYFSIHREGLFSAIGKAFGMKDIEIGDPAFDDAFLIKANNAEKLRRLLLDSRMKELLHAQPDISFRVRDDEGWFNQHFPKGVDELYFERVGVLKDEARLKALFDLFSLTLERLVQIDSAYEDDPDLSL